MAECTCPPDADLQLGCPVHDETTIENARRAKLVAARADEPTRIEQAWQNYLASWAKSVYGANGSPRDIGKEARDRSRAAFVAGWRARERSEGSPDGSEDR